MKTFKAGDAVAWSQVVAPEHEDGSVMKREAILSRDPGARLGVIVHAHHEAIAAATPEQPPDPRLVAGWYDVQFPSATADADPEVRTLTSDELIRVPAPPADAKE